MVTLSQNTLPQLAVEVMVYCSQSQRGKNAVMTQTLRDPATMALWYSFDYHTLSLGLPATALQADLFEYLCLEGQEHRRDVELNALQAMVGSDPLTPFQLTIMQDARQQHHDQAAAAQHQIDMLRQVSGT